MIHYYFKAWLRTYDLSQWVCQFYINICSRDGLPQFHNDIKTDQSEPFFIISCIVGWNTVWKIIIFYDHYFDNYYFLQMAHLSLSIFDIFLSHYVFWSFFYFAASMLFSLQNFILDYSIYYLDYIIKLWAKVKVTWFMAVFSPHSYKNVQNFWVLHLLHFCHGKIKVSGTALVWLQLFIVWAPYKILG